MGKHKLSVKKLSLSLGILSALCMLVMTVGTWLYGWWPNTTSLIMEWYPGYGMSWSGLLAGVVLGFFDGLVGGALIAWLYNKLPE